MSLYSLSIRRPVLAIVMSIAILIFGLLGLSFLGVREFPAVDPPLITVSTDYRGANADVIETQITEPLEESINAVAGIRTMTSTSREGRSTIIVEFGLESDLERAANDVRDAVSRALGNLPPDVEPPQVSKADADASPIVQVTLGSDTRDSLELTRLADELFAERLQTIPEVARVDIWGDKTYAMRLWVDPQKLAAYRLTPLDLRRAVERENVELPAGRIEGGTIELPVRVLSRLSTPDEFNAMILKEDAGGVVRLRDVGQAVLGPRNERTVLKKDGVPMVAVVLRPQPGANYIEIADEFYRRVEQIRRELPADVTVEYGFDTTDFIRKSIAEVGQTIVLALLLVVSIIFLFLRDLRTTVIPLLVIPVSLVGAFFVMYALGFSVNVLTLLALVLAIGLVVDDAIIVLENIYAKIEAGLAPLQAGVAGTREIFFAVVATTLALVAVLLPVMFLGGLTGRLFREFGATLAGAVIISSFVALSMTPMLCTRILRRYEGHSRFHRATEPFFRSLAAAYRDTLERLMTRRWLAVPLIAGCGGLITLFFWLLPAELAPIEDRSGLRLSVRGPEGATYPYMGRVMDDLGAAVAEAVPEAEQIIWVTSPGFGASSSVNSGFLRLRLVPPEQRERSQMEIADALGAVTRRLTGAQIFVTQEPTIAVGRRRGLPVQFVLQAPTLERLKDVLPRFLDEARGDPAFSEVDVDLLFDKPELTVDIDRPRARDLGISVLDVAQTVQLALSEQRLGFFVMDGKQYEVIGQVTSDNRNETIDLRNLYVASRSGAPVLLDKLVTIAERSSPPQLYRFDRYVSATVSAGLAPGLTISQGIDAMQAIADRLLDDTFHTTLAGESRDYQESSNTLVFIFGLAIVLLYLVLAAQFESFRDPFTIMLTVPLALAGALFALWWYGLTLNVFSQIGMIMLIGLVTKNGILIVEFANQRRAAGRPLIEATVEAAAARLRPVLMTSLSTVLGILPIALSLGAGSASRVPMGVAVIGGLTFGTLLTLFVVPAMYTFLTARTLVRVGADDLEGHEAA
ncbi:MAG TPA: efflux RND transporter permease subunit [Candidatus Polarisedimenticolaceae bacterium]|nr:efflux RND transporter permease subunit [Candidatus Polarisedimenticolaceae bacterium]